MAFTQAGEEIPHKDITKYNNELNNIVQLKFTKAEMDLFWAVITQLSGTGLNYAVFSYDELMKMVNPKRKSSKELTDQLKDMSKDLHTLTVLQNSKDGMDFASFTAFPTFLGSLRNKTLTVEVHRMFKPYLNEFASGFTRFSLIEYVELRSKYAKRLFIHLKQWRTKGMYIVNRAELYELLAVPNKLRRNSSLIDKKILEPAVDELSKNFKGLSYQKCNSKGEPVKKGQKVAQYRFKFEPEAPDADDLHKKEQILKRSIGVEKQKLMEIEDPAEFRYQVAKLGQLSDELEKVLDLKNVKIMDSEGNEITGDDKPVNYSKESFTWKLSNIKPSEKYQLNITAKKASQEELEKRIQQAKEQNLIKPKEAENNKPGIADQEDTSNSKTEEDKEAEKYKVHINLDDWGL